MAGTICLLVVLVAIGALVAGGVLITKLMEENERD